jgi:hypothetical protein
MIYRIMKGKDMAYYITEERVAKLARDWFVKYLVKT